MLTFEQATQEINHAGLAIATALRQQSDAGDTFAQNIIMSYSNSITEPAGSAEQSQSQASFVSWYNQWRKNYAPLVGPIASELGLEAPGGVPAATAGSIFAKPDGAAPAATVPAATEAAPQTTPVPAVSGPAGAAGRNRRAWSQTDISRLTRAILTVPADQVQTAIAAFAAQSGGRFDAGTVAAKAVELELVAAPPAPVVYEIDDATKRALTSAILTLVVADDPTIKLTQLKFAAGALRDHIKELAG